MKRFVVAMAALFMFGCASLGNVSLCATGEVLTDKGCVCLEGHVKDDDGKGCHVPEPPTTTTTSTTTTTTTTTTTLPPKPTPTPTIPPPAPSPTPCVTEPLPAGPVDVRGGLRPSSCSTPGTNNACWRVGYPITSDVTNLGDQQNVPWEHNEGFCWPAWEVARQWGESMKCLGGVCLYAQAGYLSDDDDTSRRAFDALGRRYHWDGGAWREETLPGYAWRWTNGICPPRPRVTCPTPAPTPAPTPGAACSLPPMPECGRSEGPTGVYGCCVTDKAASGFPASSPYSRVLEEVQDAEESAGTVARDRDGRVDETEYVNEILRRLTAKGICAKRGGPSDEIGIKGDNGENWQFDIHLSNGRPRRHGYTAYCRPARF